MTKISRTLILLPFLLGISVPARGQFTTINATVRDPSGAIYANAHGSASFVPSPSATQQALLSGSTFQTDVPISNIDSFGAFTLVLADNNQVTDGHAGNDVSHWRFFISSQDGKTNFNCTITITGASQDISAALQACAAPLAPTGGGGGNFVVKTVPCAATMSFTMAGAGINTSNTAFVVNPLNCNVTSSSVLPQTTGTLQTGAVAQFTLQQNNVGGFSFAWPSNFVDQPSIQVGANQTTNASFWYDGTKWHGQTFPASGAGGGGNPAGVNGDIQKKGPGGFAVAGINDSGTAISVTEPISSNSTITAPAFISSSANPALTGATRLAPGDSGCWRNNALNNDVCLSKNASDNLIWPNSFSVGSTLLSGGGGGTATFPSNTGTVAELNFAQAWTAAQSFGSGNLLPTAAGGTDLGSTALPFGSLWLGTAATNNFKVTGTATAARVVTIPDATFTVAGTTVPLGGTGASTFTTNGLLYGNGASAIQVTAASGAGTFCAVSTNGGVPTWGSCSGSAATAWSSLTNPSADLSLSMGANNSLFTHGVVTGTRNAWEFVDGASTSTGSLGFFHTGASSTMKPFTATAQGTANGAQMNTSGVLAPLGTGGITANGWTPSLTANQLVFGNGASPSTLSPLVGSLAGTNPVMTFTSGAIGNVPLALNTPASPTADIFDLNINSVKTSWVDNLGVWHAPSYTATGAGALALSGTESTCPTPAAGIDILCIGNLATHTIQSSLNGAAYKDNAQFSNSGPAAHGVCLVGSIFPQLNCTSAGSSGQAFISGGGGADGSFGTLGAVGGGTGNTTLTAHGVLMGEGTSPIAASAVGTTGQPFLSGGASADGAYGALDLSISTNTVNNLPINRGGTGASTLAAASIVTVTGAITPNNCVKWSASTVITDSGGTCGGAGGSARLDQLLGGTATNTINSTIFPQIWNWALAGSTTAFKFGENTAATGSSNILLQASTLNTSTAIPFQTDSNGNGYRLSTAGMWQPLGTGAIAVPGTAHGVVVSEGSSTAVATPATGTAGQVLISNGASADPSFQDPIVSQAFVNIWTAQDVTTTRTSSNIRNPIFSQTGTLQLTWASITGSPATCTLQIQGVDSQGNALNNGSTFSVSPANGTTSQTFTAVASVQSAAQIKAIFACVTYPTTGTLTLDFTPIPNVNVTNTVTVSGTVTSNAGTGQFNVTCTAANCPMNEAQINGVTPLMGNGTTGTGSQRVTVASDNTPFETIPVATATTTDSTSTCYLTSAASTNSTSCKGSAGNVYGIYVLNTTTTNYFLRMYNSSAAPTCSSATGFIETIPALGGAANGGGISRMQMAQGYGTGIGFCLTGGGSSTDNTNAATGVYVTILYK